MPKNETKMKKINKANRISEINNTKTNKTNKIDKVNKVNPVNLTYQPDEFIEGTPHLMMNSITFNSNRHSRKSGTLAISTIFYILIAIVSIALFIIFARSYIPTFANRLYCYTIDKVSLVTFHKGLEMCKRPSSVYNIVINPYEIKIINQTSSGNNMIEIPFCDEQNSQCNVVNSQSKVFNITVFGDNNLRNVWLKVINKNPTNVKISVALVKQPNSPINNNLFTIRHFEAIADSSNSGQNNLYQYFDISKIVRGYAFSMCNHFPCNISIAIWTPMHLNKDLNTTFNISYYDCPVVDSLVAALIKCGSLSKWGLSARNINCVNLRYNSKCQETNIDRTTICGELKRYNLIGRFNLIGISGCSHSPSTTTNSILNINISKYASVKSGFFLTYNSTSKTIQIN
ncbi:MAG: hypothetical protein GWP09_02940 [Nitrospiraceae bacterium]|nr:hypothetical protein [Nitrospiraceae bacterium]